MRRKKRLLVVEAVRACKKKAAFVTLKSWASILAAQLQEAETRDQTHKLYMMMLTMGLKADAAAVRAAFEAAEEAPSPSLTIEGKTKRELKRENGRVMKSFREWKRAVKSIAAAREAMASARRWKGMGEALVGKARALSMAAVGGCKKNAFHS